MKRFLVLCLLAVFYLASHSVSLAVEGGLGRPISGAMINPYAGLVPPLPGFAVGVTEAYYDASIGGGTTVPIGINLTLGVDMKVSFTPITILYMWPTQGKEWNFASAFSLPLAYVEAEATVTLGRLTGRVKDDDFGLFDIVLVPIVASYHISETDHVAFNFTVWAPTGEYDPDRLANLSTNTWTFIPGVAYTKIFPKANVELSVAWGLQFDTENTGTNYQNGILSDLEAAVIKRWKNGFGFGVIGSWIQQLTDDSGPTADRLNGFSGQAFGVGPIVTYSTKVGKSHLDFNARYVHEFENSNRPEGDLFQFSANLKF
ncbi:MAG TPA: transporter [Chthoniobacterales bacterium]|nr:transporter [Chthoniobacterales bacterium]